MNTNHSTPIFWYPQMKEAEQRRQTIRKAIEAGMSQAEIAEQLGVAQTTIGRYLRGERLPVRRMWGKIDRLAVTMGAEMEVGEVGAAYGSRANARTIANTPALRKQLRTAMNERNLSYPALARSIGYDHYQTIERLLVDGDIDFFPTILSQLASALQVQVVDLEVDAMARAELCELEAGARLALPVRDVPVISSANASELTVNSGVLDFPNWQEAEKVPVPTDGRNLLGFRVHGGSMSPALEDGDIVLVDRDREPQAGKLAVVIVDDEILIKTWRPHNGIIQLESINRDEGVDRIVQLEEIRWARRVVKRIGDV